MLPKKINPILDFEKLKNHFIQDIVGNDRRLRFGNAINDDYIRTYVDQTFHKVGKTHMWFIVEDKDKIVASCHVAYSKAQDMAELGLTVSPDYRNKKIGQELFTRGVTWARMHGAQNIFMHCLSENKAIQHIAKKGGMTVVTCDIGEKEGTVRVDKNPFVAGCEDAIMEQMALYDHSVRKQSWFFTKFMKMWVQ